MSKTSLRAYNSHKIIGLKWMTVRRSNPTWEIRWCFPRKVTMQTSLVGIRKDPMRKPSLALCPPNNWKTWSRFADKEHETQDDHTTGQNHLASDVIPSEVPRFFCSSSVGRADPSQCTNKVTKKKKKNLTVETLQDPRFTEIISNARSVKESTSPLSCVPISNQKLLQSNAFICFGFLNLFQAPHFPGTSAVIYDTAANTLHL